MACSLLRRSHALLSYAPQARAPQTPKHDETQDWPNLARYREENAKLPPPAAGENRVVFMGDSITDAWGRGTGEFFPGKPYVNRGISGQTTPKCSSAFAPTSSPSSPK